MLRVTEVMIVEITRKVVVGVMVVLRAPMKWSPPAAAGRWLRRALTPNQGTAALAGWLAGLVGLQGLLAEAWLGSRARRAHSQQL